MSRFYNKYNGKYYNYYDKFTMEGPDAEYLRKYIQHNICIQDIPKYFVNNILNKHIPNNRDYGSWQGFNIFGLDYIIFTLVRRDIKIYRKAIHSLKEKFIPIWLEKAYKINGCIYNKIKDRTIVGKTI